MALYIADVTRCCGNITGSNLPSMTIGIILTGFNMQEYVRPCLDAWTAARAQKLGGHEFVICAVSLPFAGFSNDGEDQTTELLRAELAAEHIDNLITEPRNIPETVARGMALTWLKDQGCELSWQVDMDEVFTINEIDRIIRFVENNRWINWFKVSYRNLVFTPDQWLVEPFTPPRIHRLNIPGLEVAGFIQDNDIVYQRGDGVFVYQVELAHLTVPTSIAHVRHFSWLNNSRSRAKVEYQVRRWGQSSFSWDDTKGLIFNPALPAPHVARDA